MCSILLFFISLMRFLPLVPMAAIDFTSNIRWFDQLDSTNDMCMECAQQGEAEGLVVAARYQTQGRGQRGNVWSSENGQNLLFSVLLRPLFLRVDEQFWITKAVAVALCRLLIQCGVLLEVRIKWPNDIYIGNRKVAGVLVENSFSSEQLEVSVVGIGINLNQSKFPASLPNPTSLALNTGRTFEPDEVLRCYLRQLSETYAMLRDGQRQALHGAYMSLLYRYGQLARYRGAAGEFEATMVGVSSIGELMLQLPNGNVQSFGFKEIAFVI